MKSTSIDVKNLEFLLYDVFDVEQLIQADYFSHHNKTMFKMIVKESITLAKKLYAPCFEEMDRHGPELVNGSVKVHKDVKKIMKETGDGGWIAARFPKEFDGDQLPEIVGTCLDYIFCMTNYSASVYPALTQGAAGLITSFGSKALIERFVPNMLSGQWQGTMALTEPQAGSSLSDITTTAFRQDGDNTDAFYKIKGRKVFISAGDHDGVDNVVHLMLAKIDGAPPGAKGISLFVVPKLRDQNGTQVQNDVVVSQVYHKMGYKGTPITELAIGDNDDCIGYLVGRENKGLSYMFQMMNHARLGVGIGACGIAAAAYQASLAYCKERPQGRLPSQKDPVEPQISILSHADVKRMLLFQKSVVEGTLGLILQCALYEDLRKTVSGEKAEEYELLLDILTPVAKTYPSEMGIHTTSAAIQCLGGYGYCEDFPVEQHFRDMRIHTIHEGTTGIQGMDLLGRKVPMKKQAAFKLLIKKIKATIEEARRVPELESYAGRLKTALDDVIEATSHKLQLAATQKADIFLADATLYLEMFGIVTIAWQWLIQALAVEKALAGKLSSKDKKFHMGKRYTYRYFFGYELVKVKGLKARLLDDDDVTLEMDNNYF